MTIRLSICIPTYNNAHVIAETLDSIIGQAGPETEIVVSDNASTDNTRQVVEDYQNKFPRIHYFRWEKNMGVDWNLLKVVELARGDYCWFLGDDVLKKGALSRVLQELDAGYDMYLCNKTCCDYAMQPFADWPWLNRKINDRVFNFSHNSDLVEYLDNAEAIGALFAFLSVDVFSRKLWNDVSYSEDITSTGF